MIDDKKKIVDKIELITRINELEKLLVDKKAKKHSIDIKNELKVDVNGIPILFDVVNEANNNPSNTSHLNYINNNNGMVSNIVDKVDKEINTDMDELINLLKN